MLAKSPFTPNTFIPRPSWKHKTFCSAPPSAQSPLPLLLCLVWSPKYETGPVRGFFLLKGIKIYIRPDVFGSLLSFLPPSLWYSFPFSSSAWPAIIKSHRGVSFCSRFLPVMSELLLTGRAWGSNVYRYFWWTLRFFHLFSRLQPMMMNIILNPHNLCPKAVKIPGRSVIDPFCYIIYIAIDSIG